ncbi:WxL domain-containing protein [Enterococcus faecalis]|uniref:WxL domain-containing protein n=1 Tax=Enterococcus faecalis TaxID=1351 RepID=UPI0012B452D7|nr:WxL domain-containing protein [Enterococcus faecalis]EGO2646434.1 WxL domain-containing protein [Enterococcus faecalis]EGO2794767.1 WxL domain-containing protein [Enterococcus faecalis]EHQ9024644.1 WxL domain-containing protein [Enterococcus faecalis]EHS2116366.1 WxL domain-containing protein [Enterococcus faecalis]EIA7703908.1 WxL domain-containing protein [Enterococcus faecalis]
MKQTKWQRLATIGLCSSLVINAFSGATAVAETITIESSPTVASSAKEATSASSATPESTESSQETTETSREEVTQETVEQEDTTEIAQEENLLEPSGIQAKIMPRAFVWAATGTTNRTTVRLNDVVDYRMKLENITTDDTNSDIVGPIRIESKLAAGMTRPTSVIIKVGPEEQNVVIGEGSHNANSGGEYFVWTESTRTVTAFINRLHGRTSGNTGYIKTLYFQTRITSGTHNEKKYIDSTIRFNGFGAVNRRNEMTYVDRFSGNLGLKGNLKFYDEDGVASKEQMSLSINPVLFKSTNSRVEGTLLRYPLTMTNAGSGLYRFDTGLKNIGTSNGGSWFFFSNDIAINFATATTNRIDKIVLAPPKATLPDSRTGVMTSRAYTSTTYTRSNYDISTYNFTKATGKTWRITNRSSNSGVSTNIMFSNNLVGTTGQFNKGNSGATINYYIYYKKLYENFVNSNGQKITPPSGFTQGKRTVINSEAYTFKQSGTLPDTYQADGKTYKFKGWYKGKTKPNTLTTTKAPSYAVTYNNDDDLTVVYEEIEFFDFPALTYQFGFVDESGKRVDASTIGLTYDKWRGELLTNNVNDWKTVSLEKGQVAPTKNNLKEIAYPAQSLEILSDRSTQYSAANLTFTLPKYYGKISVYNKSGTFDAGYLFPNIQNNNSSEPSVEGLHKNLSSWFELKKSGNQSFVFNKPIPAAPIDVQVPAYLREIVYNPDLISNTAVYYVIDKPVYYYLTNRKVTENFVDTSGAKITPPTGFTQGKQTAITSDPYTFKQAGTLPDTYTTGGKTYKFKGWYKGKTKTEPLTTTKAPSYGVTYNDNDDLNVVYEEVTAIYPGFYAQFVDEQGKAFTNSLTLSGNYTEFLRKTGTTVFETKGAFYPMVGKRDTTVTNKYKIETTSSVAVPNNYWTAMPADIANRGYALNNLDITNQMKYVDKIETTDTHTTMYDYTGVSDIGGKPNNASQTELNPIDKTFVKQTDNTFAIKSIWGNGTFSHIVPKMLLLAESGSFSRLFGFDGTPDYKQTVNYKVTRKQVTENFVDANGAKITAPTGFTQGNKIPMTSNTFKYTAAKALPATYTAGGKTYTFQGWYKGKTKPNTLTTSTTPTYNTTFDGNDDMTAIYKEEVPKASVALTRTTAETVTSGGNVTWRATITNTSQAPLTTATIKKSTAWTTGLAAPTAMIVTPAGGTAKTVPVTATTWTNGVSLGTDIPVGKSATVQFTTKATGTAGQVLRAGITTSGNYSGVSTSATVRVKDNDQAIVTPTAEGFISVPTFNFGQVGVAGSTQQHSLKKAADYYGNGTRNPYLRIKKTQANWSLTAQLSQPKSATDSLPTATRLLLGAAPVSSFSNYNQPTELKNAVGTTSAISLNANNTATRIIANQQFTGSNIYQLDFTFNNVKLEVPANQGVKGQQYQAAITWNLVTGP